MCERLYDVAGGLTMAKAHDPGPDPIYGKRMVKRISIVVTEKQTKQAQQAAKDAGKSVSTWARDIILSVLETGKFEAKAKS